MSLRLVRFTLGVLACVHVVMSLISFTFRLGTGVFACVHVVRFIAGVFACR